MQSCSHYLFNRRTIVFNLEKFIVNSYTRSVSSSIREHGINVLPRACSAMTGRNQRTRIRARASGFHINISGWNWSRRRTVRCTRYCPFIWKWQIIPSPLFLLENRIKSITRWFRRHKWCQWRFHSLAVEVAEDFIDFVVHKFSFIPMTVFCEA